HGPGGSRGLRRPRRVRRHKVEDPVHRIARTSDEAVKRHRPVHHHLALSGARGGQAIPPKDLAPWSWSVLAHFGPLSLPSPWSWHVTDFIWIADLRLR